MSHRSPYRRSRTRTPVVMPLIYALGMIGGPIILVVSIILAVK